MQTFTGVQGEAMNWGMRNAAVLFRQAQFGTNANFWANDATEDFRLETGFAPQSGFTNFGSSLNYNFNIDKFVDTAQPGAWWDATLERDGDRLVNGGVGYDMRLADVHSIELDARVVDQIEAGVPFQGWSAEVGYRANPVAWIQFEPELEVGRSFDYARLTGADRIKFDWNSNFLPTTWLRLDTLASWERFDTDAAGPDGDPRTSTLVRNLLNLQFSREFGFRVIEAYTTNTDDGPCPGQFAPAVLAAGTGNRGLRRLQRADGPAERPDGRAPGVRQGQRLDPTVGRIELSAADG